MNLVSTFKKSDDFEKMGALVSGMRNMVIEKSKDNSPAVSQDMWRKFINSLIDSVEDEFYWTVASEESGLPPDESIEFTRFPTAVALSALALDQLKFPGEMASIGIVVFKKGSDIFPLEGFGEDSYFQICEILLIFGEGSLYQWLKKSGQSERLLFQLDQWKEKLQEKLQSGDTRLSFGGDYKEIYKTILSYMKD